MLFRSFVYTVPGWGDDDRAYIIRRGRVREVLPAAKDARRKPEPGMLLDAARELKLDLSRSWMVGDRWRDIDCGRRAGVRTVFIDFGYTEELRAPPEFTVASFPAAVDAIIRATG